MTSYKKVIISSEQEWLDLRQKVVTASDMASILGFNKWKSANKMWEAKQEPPVPLDNAYITIGRWLEPVVILATNAALKTDFKLAPDDLKEFYISEEKGLGATPDGYSEDALVECKTTQPKNWILWESHPPLNYITQLYVQMLCTGKEVGYLSCLSTDLVQTSPELDIDLFIYKIVTCDKITNIFYSELERFYRTVQEGKKFRVDRKMSSMLELLIRFNIERVI